jgi:xanthine dehydrogenase YagT iron-sulfur-binding subunit
MINTTTAFLAQAETSENSTASTVGPEAVAITLQINGAARPLRVEPRMTLAEALRGPLGLTGTKIACNRGACSACTVWLDGSPICSCMMLAIDVGARRVTTIEGLAQGDTLHPVQQAFIEHDALQCGFCTPGMVMSCAALLEHMPEPMPTTSRAIAATFAAAALIRMSSPRRSRQPRYAGDDDGERRRPAHRECFLTASPASASAKWSDRSPSTSRLRCRPMPTST